MEAVVVILIIIFGILQIILFFKIWKMTNEISEINSKIEIPIEEDVFLKAEIQYYKGEINDAKDTLDTEFFKQYILLNRLDQMSDEDEKELISLFEPYYKSMNIDIPKVD